MGISLAQPSVGGPRPVRLFLSRALHGPVCEEGGRAGSMLYDNQRAISTLNGLIAICKDGENGFRVAADGVRTNSDLRLLFHAYAQERAQFAAELQAEVRRIGGDPATGGSVRGAVHRRWMHIKAAITGRDERSVLAECEAGEDAAVKAYDAALTAELGPPQRDLVNRQRAEVKRAYAKIRVLSNTSRSASQASPQT